MITGRCRAAAAPSLYATTAPLLLPAIRGHPPQESESALADLSHRIRASAITAIDQIFERIGAALGTKTGSRQTRKPNSVSEPAARPRRMRINLYLTYVKAKKSPTTKHN